MSALYVALNLAPENEIRLLNVLPKDGSGLIACELEVVDLWNKPSYIALSYTWGSPMSIDREAANDLSNQPSRSILCRAKAAFPAGPPLPWHDFFVTENLHAFLLRVQSDESLARDSYWIDALCINQDDPEERTHQVGMMGTIYRSASVVYAWLGEEDADTRMAFELIRTLAGRCLGNERHLRIYGLKDITPSALSTGALAAKLGACANSDVWLALARLFTRTYFTRVWTIQEITLAKRMIAYCGSNKIDWDDIVKVSEFLTITPWTKWMSDAAGSHADYHSVPNILDANKTSKNLLYSLIRSRRFASTDPRDKIYALLGVAGDSVRGKRRFTPIYGKRSVAETYILAALQILEDSDDLLLLSCAEGDNFRTIPSLPSWVPDWSCTKALGLGVTGYKRYSAAGGIPRTLGIDECNRSLTSEGFRIDDIVYVGESKQDVVNGKPFPNWLTIINAMPSIYSTGQPRSEVFWRVLISDTAGAPPCFPAPHHYQRTYHSWISAKLSERTKDTDHGTGIGTSFAEACELFSVPETLRVPSIPGRRPSLPAADATDIELPNDYETLFSYSRHTRPFLTSQRYLGIGSASLARHDSVWIVPGSRVPLILRQVSSSTYRIVGGAYVHGFMRGEALASSPIFSSITIV